MKRILVWTVATIATAAIAVAGGYDSQGFEPSTFVPGLLNGQDGWVAYTDGALGMDPLVVTTPDPVIGTQAVRLEVPDVQGAMSGMDHAVDLTSVVNAGGTVTVSYDIFRQEGALQNIW
ncbi:MAG: hypothetical protein JXO22_09075, partial [Phycisphaerae bacterium]|nr:hypothetical protein [Phycisphaerae bacterium]